MTFTQCPRKEPELPLERPFAHPARLGNRLRRGGLPDPGPYPSPAQATCTGRTQGLARCLPTKPAAGGPGACPRVEKRNFIAAPSYRGRARRSRAAHFRCLKHNWNARINIIDGQQRYCGSFGTKEEAALAYDRAAREHRPDLPTNYESIEAANQAADQVEVRHELAWQPQQPRPRAHEDLIRA